MKSLRIYTIVTAVLMIGLFSSCIPDSEGTITTQNPDGSTNFTSNIFGTVKDAFDQPIEDAVVRFENEMTMTDEDGVYNFQRVEVNNQHNAIHIEKEGFFEGARTFRTTSSGTLYQTTILQEKSFDLSFESAQAAVVEKDRVRISFPANSIVIESSGQSYSGEVQIAFEAIDPSNLFLSDLMPGDLSAREDDNSLTTLQSFGMVNVEMQSTSGDKLQIAENQSVELSYEVDNQFLADAPNLIDMWSFDYDLGLWIKEGEATLSGNVYSGTVSHFSCWNYDVSAPSVVLSGQLLANGTPLPYASIHILNANNSGGRGTTDSDGKFSGRVEAGVELSVTIFKYLTCIDQTVVNTIGPFNSDTDIGTINVELEDELLLEVKGTAINCDADPIINGKIQIGTSIFPIGNGEFDVTIVNCLTTSLEAIITDFEDLQRSETILLDLPGNYDIGEVDVCGLNALGVTVDNFIANPIFIPSQNNWTFYIADSVSEGIVGNISVQGNVDNVYTGLRIKFEIEDTFVSDTLELKTYELIDATFYRGDNTPEASTYQIDEQELDQSKLTIVSKIPQVNGGNEIRGTFEAPCIEVQTGNVRTITGQFTLID